MTAPTSIPSDPTAAYGLTADELWHSSFRSMGSPIRVQLGIGTARPQRCHAQVRALFNEADRQCTRFDPYSDLMRANAAGDDWHEVGVHCFVALAAAYDAHLLTDGMFEPRVLTTLTEMGYGKSWPAVGAPDVATAATTAPPAVPWEPGFDEERRVVRVGPHPIDLGGIGKGLTLRWAAELLRDSGAEVFLVDAGGDCVMSGGGPDGGGWRVGVEDPAGGSAPVAVLVIDSGGCATSSTRLRRWRAGGEDVHHLIDPRTGRSGGGELRSVTVVHPDPAEGEVWSKTLFLHGAAIADEAERRQLAALWVDSGGAVRFSAAMRDHLLWWRE
ncbi:MAG TPA: FAD:protein FMN transferase [Jatrophihabitans sp.]|nr:FAD:protein FMN transferase [Jatrophihabitans sp.]